MQQLSNRARSRDAEPPQLLRRQEGCASLEGIVIGTTFVIVAFCIALAGNVGAALVFLIR